MIVAKFGGSSVADAERIGRVSERVAASRRQDAVVVVVSALGRATRALVNASESVRSGRGGDARARVSGLMERHRSVARDLELAPDSAAKTLEALDRIEIEALDLVRRLEAESDRFGAGRDGLLAVGERAASILVTACLLRSGLPATLVDARSIVRTDDRFGAARPDQDVLGGLARTRLLPLLDEGRVPVLQGFIGATGSGETTTMGFEASDYTATLLAAGLGAREVHIWTDVNGILTADNRLVPEARTVPELSFAEAAELALHGARVLHPNTMRPLVGGRIPLLVRNAWDPAGPLSRVCIGHGPGDSGAPVAGLPRSIACLEGCVEVTCHATAPRPDEALMRRVSSIVSDHSGEAVLAKGGPSGAFVLLRPRGLGPALPPGLEQALSALGRVECRGERALLTLVGRGVGLRPSISARFAESVGGDGEVRLVHGASGFTISASVPARGSRALLSRLHQRFFGGKESAATEVAAG